MGSWSALQILCALLYAGNLFAVFRATPFQELLSNRFRQHLIFGSAASLFFLWLFRTGIPDSPTVHFLWLTALCLTLGYRHAIIASGLTFLGMIIVGYEPLNMWGVKGLLGVAIPVGLTYLIYNFSFHKLYRHFFMYIFVCAFFTGALMISVKMLLLSGYYHLDGIYDDGVIYDNYIMLIPLMLFSEAMLNGITMTMLVVYKPQWVYTFYDKFYFDEDKSKNKLSVEKEQEEKKNKGNQTNDSPEE